MDIIEEAVIKFGTQAVLRYRTISRRPDNELPEVFIGGFIAPRLYEWFDCPVHIEHDYLAVAKNLKVPKTPDSVKQVGSYRADIAMYRDGLLPVIIELKLFDETGQPPLDDLGKIKTLFDICEGKVSGYLGVLICATENILLEERIRRLEESLGRTVHTGEPQQSADGNWRWCFGCASLSEMPQV